MTSLTRRGSTRAGEARRLSTSDQIGNRARGDRLTEPLTEDELACVALLLLTAPFTPMLFQGEEWAASTPFQFFTSHPEPEFGRATAEGRLAEFARMGWNPDAVPDPQDEQTFQNLQARLVHTHILRRRHESNADRPLNRSPHLRLGNNASLTRIRD